MSEYRANRWNRVTVRALGVGVLATAIATVLALLIADLGAASQVAVYMLAIVVGAVTGGLWAGILAAILSSIAFLVLEDPNRVLRFDEPRDIVAAVVFLAVAAVVGFVVGNAADERDRASRREREARLLGHLSTQMLSGDVPDRVLEEFVQVLIEPFGLAACELTVTLDGQAMRARATDDREQQGGPTEIVPVVVANIPLGTLIAQRPAGRRPMNREERLLLEAATRQAAVALDRARLDARARLAQVDAETNQLRAAMFSSVTHDLKTPLASIKAGVTSLLDVTAPHDEHQQRELLTTILEETDRLHRLVNNILDLARIRAGALIPRRVPAAIDEIAESVVGRLRGMVDGVFIELKLAPELPEAPVDPVQIDQVLTNLLENAGRHAPKGSTVRVHVTQVGDAIRVRVADEGSGIPPEEREIVFDAFYRGRENPESSGTGLGLAIAKAIVVAHGGRIWVEETAAGGTALVVELPKEAVAL